MARPARYCLALLLCLLTGAALAQGGGLGALFDGGEDDFLPVEEAFPLTLRLADERRLVARWETVEGYYLYRDKFEFEVVGGAPGIERMEIPPGEVTEDEYFGRQEVYREPVAASVYLDAPVNGPIDVRVSFQGCADDGLCYPPETVTVALDGGIGATMTAGDAPPPTGGLLRAGTGELAGILEGGSPWLVIGGFFVAGLLLAFSACLYPMIPILSGLIAGDRKRAHGSRAFLLSLVYVQSTAVTYALAGLAAGLSGAAVQASLQSPWLLGAFAALFVLLALSMFGLFELRLPATWQTRLTTLSSSHRGGSFAGVAVMGVLSTLIAGACSGPALVAALAFIASTGDAALGTLALFALANGMGLPLLAVGTAAGKWLPQSGAWMTAIQRVFGVLFLAVALWLLERFLPAALVLMLWGALLLGAGIFWGGLDAVPATAAGRFRLRKAGGLLLVVWGVAAVIGAAGGGGDVLRPLHGLTAESAREAANAEDLAVGRFQEVETVAELDAALRRANAAGVPAMVDVYADWCVYCVQLDERTSSDAGVSRVLEDAVLLRVDVTANDADDKALLRRLDVYLPPAVLFFAADGREAEGYRVNGFLGPEEFATRARSAMRGGAGQG